jgi:hypothetical protein
MTTRRSNRGVSIDLDALIAASIASPAVGNMKVNAAGDVLGPGGEILQKNEERVRAYYKNNPRSSTSQASLKSPNEKLTPDAVESNIVPKTTVTAKENTRTKKAAAAEQLPQQPSEFDAPDNQEPMGYKEVTLPNGDIEMVPIFKGNSDE